MECNRSAIPLWIAPLCAAMLGVMRGAMHKGLPKADLTID